MVAKTPKPAECSTCGAGLHPRIVRTTMWAGDTLYVVEDIPAQVCDACSGTTYDEDTTRALRRLQEEGFASAPAQREILVPVFSLKSLLT